VTTRRPAYVVEEEQRSIGLKFGRPPMSLTGVLSKRVVPSSSLLNDIFRSPSPLFLAADPFARNADAPLGLRML
jgi:hypothetical protein